MSHVKFKKDHLDDAVVNTYQFNNVDEAKATQSLLVRKQKMFEDVENTGSEITYRCSKCRKCKVCKEHSTDEIMSVKEEVKQDVINKSAKVDVASQRTTASLPLMNNPSIKIAHNKERALKVYNQQIKKLNQNTDDKKDVIESEEKLQQLGYVDYVRNLKTERQEMLRKSEIQNFIPWRTVWYGNSISTPCRVAFDASHPDDILAKGKNNMKKLVEIVIRWSIHKIGYHTDIKKMYNSVKLVEDDWCLQRRIWQKDLDPRKLPEEKVIKTLVYGVKSSGNQAERGLRETARLSAEEYPKVIEFWILKLFKMTFI